MTGWTPEQIDGFVRDIIRRHGNALYNVEIGDVRTIVASTLAALPSSSAARGTHASGEFREKALAWWKSHMQSRVIDIYIRGDGFVRFEWDDGNEQGSYHVRLDALYSDAAAARDKVLGWQDISTAPRDEEIDVLLYIPSLCVSVRQGRWDEEAQQWTCVNYEPHDGKWPQPAKWYPFPSLKSSPPAPASASSPDRTEYGWVLEKGNVSAPEYITATVVGLEWTKDPDKALRLARRADADALANIVEDCYRVEEHAWVAAAPDFEDALRDGAETFLNAMARDSVSSLGASPEQDGGAVRDAYAKGFLEGQQFARQSSTASLASMRKVGEAARELLLYEEYGDNRPYKDALWLALYDALASLTPSQAKDKSDAGANS